MYRYLAPRPRRGAIAALGSAAALVTGLAGASPARGVTAPIQARRSVQAVTARGLALGERNRLLAIPLFVEIGWSFRQYRCLDRLWTRESGWNHRARNRSSGAYGIPQALPGEKMADAGSDWRTNAVTQIRWGLGYIRDRYGGPCAAWGHMASAGWY